MRETPIVAAQLLSRTSNRPRRDPDEFGTVLSRRAYGRRRRSAVRRRADELIAKGIDDVMTLLDGYGTLVALDCGKDPLSQGDGSVNA
jgi:hypothetical protein